jgi:hypothetical protein
VNILSQEIGKWMNSNDRWECQKFKITHKDGQYYYSHFSGDSYKIAMIKMKLIKQGANPRDLEDFGQLNYKEGCDNYE